jgi:hypothetical protein
VAQGSHLRQLLRRQVVVGTVGINLNIRKTFLGGPTT